MARQPQKGSALSHIIIQLSETLINKGVGRARILWKGLSVDVFTTHLVSYTDSPSETSEIRRQQTKKVSAFILRTRPTADLQILAADFNDFGPTQQLVFSQT